MPGKIFLTRHGESEYNILKKIGGNSSLSDKGKNYSKILFDYFNLNNILSNTKIYSSNMIRTKETLKYFDNIDVINLDILNEINAGDFEHMTYQEIKEKNPQNYFDRINDKYYYRYPNGESYSDLKNRVLEIFKIINEDSQNVLIVAHNAVIRVIVGVLMNIDDEEIPHLDIPLHTLITLKENYNGYSSTFTKLY